jgi:hypothetical protein
MRCGTAILAVIKRMHGRTARATYWNHGRDARATGKPPDKTPGGLPLAILTDGRIIISGGSGWAARRFRRRLTELNLMPFIRVPVFLFLFIFD